MHVGAEKSFNGGLIDFHENVLRADLSPYLSPQQQFVQAQPQQFIQAQQQQFIQSQYPPSSMSQTPQFISSAPQFISSTPQFISSPPSQFMPTQCIPGPPSFVHLNGQVYRPVADELTPPPEPPAPTPKDLDREFNRRVQQSVDEAMSKLKPVVGTSTRGKKDKKENVKQTLQQLNTSMRQCIPTR